MNNHRDDWAAPELGMGLCHSRESGLHGARSEAEIRRRQALRVSSMGVSVCAHDVYMCAQVVYVCVLPF